MVGIRLIIVMAVVGGLIAYIADKMGSKIGKRKMSVFGLRPKYTSILLTVTSGTIIAVLTIGVMAVASQSARTALFGMDKLQQELKLLNEEKEDAAAALTAAKDKVDEQNHKISLLDAKILESTRENDEMDAKLAQVNDMYSKAQAEVASLTDAKDQLTGEIENLEKTTEALRKGIINMREGQVYYRAGEIVYAGIMRGGLKHEENIVQVNWLLQNANEAALQRLGVRQEEEQPLQAIWLSKNMVTDAVNALDKSKGNLFFRLRTVANIIVGELVVCEIEIFENQFIYPDGSLIFSNEYTGVSPELYENVIMAFLTQVNHKAVEAGVLPDPLTGKVGNMDAATMIETSNAMRRTNGNFTLRAYAKGDITTAGPVRVRLEVLPNNE
ncbi:MAG: DUF3084 domain-containing protein [Phascolarctobacterium sp.]|uniref:DUF3084 domain-containing protein n=1 Tax=Phascolarctobacterium sp. TaxID=2049039 RepID=UPI0026DCC5C4|nr:DUF3084 domain-containing protein [Phascolarctobacterium sp.]MDO4921750.1 DUF3084 domain-containing protein [Phascolarctobacterium sp.]